MRIKLVFLYLLVSNFFYLKAQFNKQLIISGGFQISIYNQTYKYNDSKGNSYTKNGNQTNIGITTELGYFIKKNLSLSYQFTYLFYDDNKMNSTHDIVKLYRNGISLNKYFLIKQDLLINIGATPFYGKRSYKESVLDVIEYPTHGCVFTTGISFPIERNGILGINLYKILDNEPEGFNYQKAGVLVSYKFLFPKNK